MNLRTKTTLLIVAFIAVAGASMFAFTTFGPIALMRFFPEVFSTNMLLAYRILLVVQTLFIIACFITFGLFWYDAFHKSIAQPIRSIALAMREFQTTGKLMAPEIGPAPEELRELRTIFIDFAQNVSAAHERDLETSRVKSDFISTAAHQLRTPLTGIRWALEALAKEPLEEGEKVLVQNAVDKSKDLVAVVGTLLDISSIESGKYKYDFAAVDIGAIVAQVTADFAPLATSTNVQLSFTPPTSPLPPAQADKDRIKWVLNNLVENAIRYTPPGGSVQTCVRTEAGMLNVVVTDTGIGIQPEDRNNIFERFYRAGNAIAKENKGSGLGLYIARTIATDHGGDLTFAPNTVGPGTAFVLSLPILT